MINLFNLTEVKDLHPLKVEFILLSSGASLFEKSTDINEEQPSKKESISVTKEESNLSNPHLIIFVNL